MESLTQGEMMKKYYKTLKAFDYLTAGEVYAVYPIDKSNMRFWNEAKDCGTFLANWKAQEAINNKFLMEVVNA